MKFSAGTGVAEKKWTVVAARGQAQRSAVSGQRSAVSGQRSAIMSVGEYPLQALNEHCCTRSGSTAGGHNPRF